MCHDERFLNLWIKDSPFSLDYITNLPRYVGLNHFQTTLDDKSGYDHVPLHPQSRTFFGLGWKGYYFVYKNSSFWLESRRVHLQLYWHGCNLPYQIAWHPLLQLHRR